MTDGILAKCVEKGEGLFLEMYRDLLQDACQNVGFALGTVFEALGIPFFALKCQNERVKERIKSRLQQYSEKVESTPVDQICEVPPEVGFPIVERFSYTTNQHIANMFVNLLANASTEKTVNMAQPRFVHIIDSISSDEAMILQYIYSNLRVADSYQPIPMINIIRKMKAKDGGLTPGEVIISDFLTMIETKLNLLYPENTSLYFVNLISLGLLSYPDRRHLVEEGLYGEVLNTYSSFISQVQESLGESFVVEPQKRLLRVTPFGMQFLKACMSNPSNLN